MSDSVQQLAFKCGLTGIQEQRISDFSTSHGEEASIEILQKIVQIRDHQKGNGMRQDTAQYLWNKHSGEYKKASGSKRRAREQEAAQRASEAAYWVSVKSGFVPTQEVLRKQIEALYKAGEINAEAYSHGMAGVKMAKDLVAVAGVLTEDEAGMEEFGF